MNDLFLLVENFLFLHYWRQAKDWADQQIIACWCPSRHASLSCWASLTLILLPYLYICNTKILRILHFFIDSSNIKPCRKDDNGHQNTWGSREHLKVTVVSGGGLGLNPWLAVATLCIRNFCYFLCPQPHYFCAQNCSKYAYLVYLQYLLVWKLQFVRVNHV